MCDCVIVCWWLVNTCVTLFSGSSWCCRIIWKWDLEPAPVCKNAAQLLDAHKFDPIVCLSALNPALFESVWFPAIWRMCSRGRVTVTVPVTVL